MKRFLLLFLTLFSFSQLVSDDLSWSSPVMLSTALVNASNPVTVMDVNGNMTAAWIENGFVKASFMPLNGSWGTVQTLSASGATSAHLAVDATGNVTAIWLDSSGIVNVSTMPINGSFGSATALSASASSSPVISVNSSGAMVAVWVNNGYIQSSSKTVSGTWTLVSTLSAANSNHPHVSVGDNGTVVAVWHTVLTNSSNGNSDTTYSATQTVGGSWSAPIDLLPVATGFSQDYPKVSVDINGNADAIWYGFEFTNGVYSNVVVYAETLPSGSSSWSIPVLISSTGIGNPANLFSKIGHDQMGNGFAMYSLTYDGSSHTIEISTKPLNTGWNPSAVLGYTNYYSFAGDFAINSLSDAVATYMYFDGTNASIQSQQVNLVDFGSQIIASPAVYISTTPDNGYPKIGTAYVGGVEYAGAVWLASDGTTTSLQASVGSRMPVSPPTGLTVTQTETNFGVFQDYINTLTWTASPSPSVFEYIVFKNGNYFTTVNIYSPLSVTDHNQTPSGSVTYGVVAIDESAYASETASITFP